MPAWSEPEEAELRRLWDIHGGRFRRIADEMGRTRGSIDGKSRVLGLQFHGGRARVLEANNSAVLEARTIFPSRVISPDNSVLKSGDNQRKLGKIITKGRWKGFPVFSLTLEERATCPTTCLQWRSCYGNNSGHAKRYEHGSDLERQLWKELYFLQQKYPGGFVVRAHLLGDFYSVSYVDLWRAALDHFPAMCVFGYTAWTCDTAIGQAVAKIRNSHWDRFAVRTSGARRGLRTIVFQARAPKGVIPCPAQEGRTASCSTCGLCWQTKRPIGFKAH